MCVSLLTHPPTHLIQNVIYQPAGEKLLTKGQRFVYAFVREHYELPEDLEQNSKVGGWVGGWVDSMN